MLDRVCFRRFTQLENYLTTNSNQLIVNFLQLLGFVSHINLLNMFLFQVESGKIMLEGCISEDYYKVKELLYEQYAIL